MQAVDRADERRVDAVAEHAANVIGDRSSDVARYREGEGLHRSQPRLAVLGSDGKPPPRHEDVCAALELSDDGGPGSFELALIRSGCAPGTFTVTRAMSG